jgi:hypothetical protein
MIVPPLFWVTCGQAARIRRAHTKKQIEATKRRRAIESTIEDQKMAKELGLTLREFQDLTGPCPEVKDVVQ